LLRRRGAELDVGFVGPWYCGRNFRGGWLLANRRSERFQTSEAAIALGDGGKNHTETLRALVEAGADVNIPDGSGATPLKLARNRGYRDMVAILEKSGAK
jgi:ankyrin repeat protein